ncbi:MAG TPA: hypothetical protein VK978_01155 [Candidatus Saccharimonadales bacterium]|nr:hypothetical protein [Candidatus Saccharimonadales bacterium]
MSDAIASGTAGGVIDYLDSLVARGRSQPGVVTPLKTAVTKVLERTEGSEWAETDMLSFDIEDAMDRFKALTLMEYSAGSYRTYQLRIERALQWYLTFLRNPGWSPPESARAATIRSKQTAPPTAGLTEEQTGTATVGSAVPGPVPTADGEAISYPFPLANGRLATLSIPKTISRADVRRLSSFLEALVVTEE